MYRIATLALSLIAAALHAPARADSIADFYRGKTFTIVIGSPPGGEFSAWGRLVSQYIGKYIPGAPATITQDMPGAGSLKAANWIYAVAPKDGTVVALIQTGTPFEPLTGNTAAQFDPARLNWIGSPTKDTVVCAADRDSPVRDMKDLFATELLVGGSAAGSDTMIYPAFLRGILGMKFRAIAGYPGIQDIALAIERGELNGACTSFSTLARQSIYANGRVRLLFQAALEKDPFIPAEVPLVAGPGLSDADRETLNLFLARIEVGRPFVAPPGTPADRVAVLRAAFAATMEDRDFVADAQKMKLNVEPLTGEAISNVVQSAYRAPQAVVNRMNAMLAGPADANSGGK